MITMFDIYGNIFKEFWRDVRDVYPNLPCVYYEVLVDFWEDVYDDMLPLHENVMMAYDYIVEHEHDYD